MLSVLNSRRLEVLADLHARRACQPTNSSAVPETVLVQSLGITRWLSCCLADCPDGDVHVHFPFSATCIWELFERVRLNVPETSLFSSDVLTWRAGLNRLLVGDALRGGNTRVSAEIPCDDAVETGKARVLGWLHTFTEAAFGLIAPLCDRRPGNAWLKTGAVLNERFFAPDARENPDVQAIQQALPHIGHDTAHASFAGPVSLDVLTPGLRHSLAASTERTMRSGVMSMAH